MADKMKLNKTNLDKLEAVDGKRRIVWDSAIQGYGVRIMPTGVKTLFFQTRFNGEVIRVTIGRYTGTAPSAEQSRKRALEINADIANGIDPRPEKKEAEAATFGDLLTGYVELLEAKGKKSARNVKNHVTADVQKAQPKIWKKRAAEIDLDDCIKVVADVKDRGKLRQADKIRSYIRSAFTEAIKARGNVNAPAKLRNMNIRSNPARDMVKVEGSSQARTRALSLSEFRAYWEHVKALPEPGRSVMMLHVLTGGQRIQQLSRVTLQDIDRDTQTVTLLDYKGRRAEPRRHSIPLLPEALACIERLTGAGSYVFSCDGGQNPINGKYISERVDKIRDAMKEAKELEGGHFTPGTIRATIETRLAAKPYRVGSDVLGQLLSHGLGGVQARHYQHHSFNEEKLEALQMLYRMVEGLPEPTAQVIPFNREATA
ncbi:integrase family protein [Marinobacter salinexigens]|uniref:Integrase family protein n=1 Tax=Marinobacter salinexigens TaxID=2919747 RepID=A0A5B0V9D0_9GAMM|nr:integrase family protein [Marinobacter salinexigens]KAA1171034.1 integrase family protein [Marinobacter salinexigens]